MNTNSAKILNLPPREIAFHFEAHVDNRWRTFDRAVRLGHVDIRLLRGRPCVWLSLGAFRLVVGWVEVGTAAEGEEQ